MVLMMAMLAFSIDMGFVCAMRTEAQRAADAGALAGAARLGENPNVAIEVARQYVQANRVGGSPVPDSQLDVEAGVWNAVTRRFVPTIDSPSALRVFARQPSLPLFFARVLNQQRFDIAAEAIAIYQPRDIVVVLDFSASMSDDSELVHIRSIGRGAVEANLLEIYQQLGAPVFGNLTWRPRGVFGTTASVIAQLGLDTVAYPCPRGSWAEYVQYVKTSGSVSSAGYRDQYGYLTLVNYWLEQRPMASETPDLWRTSEQPVTAVKDSVDLFLAYLAEGDMDDRVGLAIYTYSDGTAILESPLTGDYAELASLSRQRQAGHYDHFTNIGAGMEKAREELEQNGRPGALRMMVLMTDGIANRPTNSTVARQYVLDEAQRAADQGFPIVTISLGAGADTALMDQVANLTAGVHFNIPGGQTVEAYEEDLKDAFREIAAHRPLQLVQ
jgi:hypothetical protein